VNELLEKNDLQFIHLARLGGFANLWQLDGSILPLALQPADETEGF